MAKIILKYEMTHFFLLKVYGNILCISTVTLIMKINTPFLL